MFWEEHLLRGSGAHCRSEMIQGLVRIGDVSIENPACRDVRTAVLVGVKSNNRRSRTQGCRPRGTGGFSETVSDPFLGTSSARGRSREQAANNSVNADSSACHEAASTEREEEGERVMFLLDLQQEGRDFQQCRRTRALPSRSFLVVPRSGTCLASELS